jgi:hypothetical protein
MSFQMSEWGDKDADMEGWHHRGPTGSHRGRMHGNVLSAITKYY